MNSSSIHISRKPLEQNKESRFIKLAKIVNVLLFFVLFLGICAAIVYASLKTREFELDGAGALLLVALAGFIPAATIFALTSRLILRSNSKQAYEHINVSWGSSIEQGLLLFEKRRRKLAVNVILIRRIAWIVVFYPFIHPVLMARSFSYLDFDSLTISFGFSVLFFLIVWLPAFLFTPSKRFKKYEEEFRKEFVPAFVQNLLPDLNFYSDKGISETTFKESGLFTQKYSSYKTSHYFEGHIDNCPVKFSNVRTSSISVSVGSVVRDEPVAFPHVSKNETVHFDGFFAMVELELSFKGSLFIVPKRYELPKKYLQLDIKDQGFSSSYKLFSNKKANAKAFLSKEMKKIITTNRDFAFDLYIALHNNSLYITTSNSNFVTPPCLKGSCTDPKLFKKLISDIYSITDICKAIHSNKKFLSC